MSHDHGFTFSFTTGPQALQLLLMLGGLTVAAFALLRPFLPEQGRAVALAITGTAGGATLVQLLLADGIDVPRASVALLLGVLAVPLAVAIRRDHPDRLFAIVTRRMAPYVIVAAAAGAGTEVVRAWSGAAPADGARLLATGLMVGLVGASWLTVWRPSARRAAAVGHLVALFLGCVLVAGTAQFALTTL